jgi:hypothetical protein
MTAALSLIAGGVATPRGFRAAGVSAGIKASGNPDLMLLVADAPAQVAAVFTTNKVIAAPVIVSKEHLARSGGTARAIVVNSGCANACTGDAGLRDAREMAAETARLVGCPVEQVLVSSTGVIGVNLPMDKVRGGLPSAFKALGADQGAAAARADQHRRTRRAHRRDGEGRRHDRADDGDDARVRDDGCGGAEGAAGPRAPRSRGSDVQRDHRRRRLLDQRLRAVARQRRQRRGRR